MVTEKEYSIIRALVEDEMESIREGDYFDTKILMDYLMTLSDIVEKLKRDCDGERRFSEEIAFQ